MCGHGNQVVRINTPLDHLLLPPDTTFSSFKTMSVHSRKLFANAMV